MAPVAERSTGCAVQKLYLACVALDLSLPLLLLLRLFLSLHQSLYVLWEVLHFQEFCKHTEYIKFQHLGEGARSLIILFFYIEGKKISMSVPLLAFLEESFSLYMSMYAFVELLGHKSRRFGKNTLLYNVFYKGLLWHHKCRTRRLHTPGKGTGVIAPAP